MSMLAFIKKAERQSRENINRDYRNIDMLHYHLDFLNNLLQRYSNKISGRTLSAKKRQEEMNDIRERIPRVYQDINYYKECINAERKEMKRIHDTYGSSYTYKYNQEKYEDVPNTLHIDYNDNDEYLTYEDDDVPYDYDEELEEIKEYKYNPARDTWE
jgi:chromosome segregation ATPase